MKKIIIIGASAAGHNVAVNLRQSNNDCSITLLTEESYPFYDRSKLFNLVSSEMKEKDIFLASPDFYKQKNIEFLSDTRVTLVNAQKRVVYCKEKEALGYDFLVVCSGRKFILPDIPGAKKNGVFCFYSLADLKKIEGYFVGDTVCLAGRDGLVMKAAASFAAKNKEIKVINTSASGALKEDSAEPGAEKRIEVINSNLLEIIGESQVQAVKLSEGKIIGASAVIFMDELKSNIDFLKNTGVEINADFISVDAEMRTSISNIFSCGLASKVKGADDSVKGFDTISNESRILAETLVKALAQQ
ncbi:MAG: FAD-dependent oxidoreductase [Candidatus Omnitrophica bacterium]|nr:FAD-dependent oxidoreductase [Candidatus Omnitrophota bacterium]